MFRPKILATLASLVFTHPAPFAAEPPEPIRAFCVDFNWGEGGPNAFAKPGLWADADPAKHVAWYEALGANVIQTFAISCNGYAWYQGGKIPAQPGLAHDFLPEVVKLGHAKKMKVMSGFSKPNPDSLPLPIATYLGRPIESFHGNDRNIAILAHIFNGKPLPAPVPSPITASSVWGPGHEAEKALDGDETTRWGAAPDTRGGWLELDLGMEKPIGRATVVELAFPRTQEFVIEYKHGVEWKPLHRGTTIGGNRVFEFTPVNARHVRLNILKASDVPTIEEFHL